MTRRCAGIVGQIARCRLFDPAHEAAAPAHL